MPRILAVLDLGRHPYRATHLLQRRIAERRLAGALEHDVLLLVEHEPTVTLGRGTKPTSLPLPVAELERRGLTVEEVERGGDVTWHGPGQLVGYPILDLARHRPDLHWYLRQVEEALIRALARLGVAGERNPGCTGVWTAGRKIASIGIHVRQWVTTHGFALNLVNDLAAFDLIVPCGLSGVQMTSVARELERAGAGADPATLRPAAVAAVVESFGEVFGLEPERVPPGALLPEGTGVLHPAF
ncbi:MAG TPA: lipoyl(octanoyl) transferase LipB [Gemmatimonadales bacterium]|jgi:lipoate-protein ligase B|nr:lipoyl(octanoyl) transferase LipB [Gemmatimonadales bacterium]